MQKLMKWVGVAGDWSPSELQLPRLDRDAEPALQRWCVVAGGLALVLSRLEPAQRAARFAQSERLYTLIRHALVTARPVPAGAELLGDVMHEIAEVADLPTRSCLKACFQDCLREPPRGDASLAGGRTAANASALSSQERSSRRSTQGAQREAADTSFNEALLAERASALHRAVAVARNTVIGELEPAQHRGQGGPAGRN